MWWLGGRSLQDVEEVFITLVVKNKMGLEINGKKTNFLEYHQTLQWEWLSKTFYT
jgi:hypothetical protein